MKVVSGSDFHLEHYFNFENFGLSSYFMNNEYEADVLVLAGDILDTSCLFLDRIDDWFSRLSDSYNHVIYVMGNHEHYCGDFVMTAERISRQLARYPNIKLLDKRGVNIDGIRFFGGTMWTNFDNADPIGMHAAKKYMNDYNYIKNSKKPVTFRTYDEEGNVQFKTREGHLTPDDVLEDHNNFMNALTTDMIAHPDKEYFVVTHHSPSYSMCHESFRGDVLNCCYHSNLDDFIMDHPQIKKWCFGHTHGRKRLQIGECEVVLNARGYAMEKISQTFDVAEIEI